MSSETIVVLALVALAIIGIVYLEMHSRRNRSKGETKSQSENND
jgi:hypothetical protein